MITVRRDMLVSCAKCKHGFLVLSATEQDRVRCAACTARYPVDDGVIDLLPPAAGRPSPAQRTMESEPIVRVYESRLWRRSRIAALALGISFEEEQAVIFGAANLKRSATVLDLACGPGIYTRPLAERVTSGTVVGLDLSLPMLRYASQRTREQRLGNIILLHGDATRLPFPPGCFDLVNCCGALHLFPNIGRVLREVHRVLKPGGRLTAAAARRADGPVGLLMASASPRLLGVRPFSAEELQSLCERAGFRDVRLHHARRLWLIMSAKKGAHSSAGIEVKKRR